MEYLHWKEETVTDFSEKNITNLYNKGFVFTRIGKGVMHQTRSVRIDLSKFELSSENRRVLKKLSAEKIDSLHLISLPMPNYHWSFGKFMKDFYDKKFGPGIFSVQKIKEILEDTGINFNMMLNYDGRGYVICYQNNEILHYSYPFYNLEKSPKDMGLGMMIKAIVWAKENGSKYVYLGSLQRPTDTYKLQFAGLEWFDGTKWSNDLEEVKMILNG